MSAEKHRDMQFAQQLQVYLEQLTATLEQVSQAQEVLAALQAKLKEKSSYLHEVLSSYGVIKLINAELYKYVEGMGAGMTCRVEEGRLIVFHTNGLTEPDTRIAGAINGLINNLGIPEDKIVRKVEGFDRVNTVAEILIDHSLIMALKSRAQAEVRQPD